LLATAAFSLAPYPFFATLYSRGAIPELLAIALLPWALWAAWGMWRHRDLAAWPLALALCTAALAFSHNMVGPLGIGVTGLWLLALAAGQWRRSPRAVRAAVSRRTLYGVGAMGAGLALVAFFWLPMVAEARLVQLERAQQGILDFRTWLIDPLAAARSVPAAAGDPPGEAPPAAHGVVVALQQAYAVVDVVAKGEARAPIGNVSGGQALLWLVGVAVATLRRRLLPLGWAAVALLCWLLSTVWAEPLWQRSVILPIFQFPQRLFGLLALGVALASAGALAALPGRGAAAWAGRAVAAALVLLLVQGTLAGRPYLVREPPAGDVGGHMLVAREENWFGHGTTSGGEFLPRTVQWPPYPSSGRLEGLRLYDLAFPEASWQAGLVRVLEGRGAATAVYRGHDQPWIAAEVEAATPLRLGFHQLLFPGWRAYVDGVPVAVEPAHVTVSGPSPQDGQLEASLGFMVVDVPAGRHLVEVRWGPTLARALGWAVSAATLVAGAAAVIAGRLQRRRGPGGSWRPAVVALAAAGAAGCAVAAGELDARPQQTPPASAARVILDVATAVTRGQAATRAPAGAGRGLLPPYLEVSYLRLGADERRWLFMHPPSEASVTLRVPPGAMLQAGLGLDPRTWTAEAGDGVRFIVEAEAAQGASGSRIRLFDRDVSPREQEDARRWLDVWVDLGTLAGREVRLVLRTEERFDTLYDWAGWANPQVIVWDAARPPPTTPHPW
ncbi:MAG TPA: hypothetical protein VHS99_19615, partial [Chloroflexota bacterium]|nr:hypothetical protein [Chloroflexota bacterium]